MSAWRSAARSRWELALLKCCGSVCKRDAWLLADCMSVLDHSFKGRSFVISRHPSASRDLYQELSSSGSSLPAVCHHALLPCFSFEDLLCPFLLYLLVSFHPCPFLSICTFCASANPFLGHFLLFVLAGFLIHQCSALHGKPKQFKLNQLF